MTKVFISYGKKLGITAGYATYSVEALKTCVDMVKAAIHHGPNCWANLEIYKNTNFEEIQSADMLTNWTIFFDS